MDQPIKKSAVIVATNGRTTDADEKLAESITPNVPCGGSEPN